MTPEFRLSYHIFNFVRLFLKLVFDGEQFDLIFLGRGDFFTWVCLDLACFFTGADVTRALKQRCHETLFDRISEQTSSKKIS